MAKTADASKAKDSAKDDADFLAEALRRYERGMNKDRANIDEALVDLGFMTCRAEDQWPIQAMRAREAEGRPVLTMPQVPKFVRQVTGDMRLSRPGIRVVPVDNRGDKKTAEVLAGLVRYIENRSSARHAYTKGADLQVACGIGHWRVVTEYADATTFNQEIRIVGVDDGVFVIWDPDAVLPTREDARYCFVPVDMSEAQFRERFPDASPSDFGEWDGWVSGDMVRVAEYWEKRPEKRLLALLPDGSIDDLTDKGAEAVAQARAAGARVEQRDSWAVYRSLICAGQVLEPARRWPGRYIPVVPVIGEEIHFGRETIRRGLVRAMRDAQRLYNYSISAQAEVVAMQPRAPFIVADEQIRKYLPEWEAANSVNRPFLRYTPQANAPVPQRVQPPVSSQGIDDLIDRAMQDMRETTGIYDAGLGARSNETSGKAIQARQREADVGTFVYMDNWSLSIEHTGRILIDLIPHIYDTQRIIRILGEDGKVDTIEINRTDPRPIEEGGTPAIENDVTVGAYDVILQTGPSYSTRREEAREGMIEFLRAQPGIGPAIADLVAKAQDWPMADEIAERIEAILPPQIQKLVEEKKAPEDRRPPDPPDPMQQQAVMLEMRDKAADIGKKEAEAQNRQVDTAAKAFGLQLQQAQFAGAMAQPPGPGNQEIAQALAMLAAAVQQQGQQISTLTQALTGRAA